MAERRKLTRFEVSAPVRLIVTRGDAAQDYAARARDISVAGAFIYFEDSCVDIGDRVLVEVLLTIANRSDESDARHRIPIFGGGKICRVESDGVALAFDQHLHLG